MWIFIIALFVFCIFSQYRINKLNENIQQLHRMYLTLTDFDDDFWKEEDVLW